MKNYQLKLTILVPIYNVSEYLPLCLDSIMNQSFSNFECLLINDGSTDNSLEILRKYTEKDSRFKIIDQKNIGYGASLNKGIKLAEGEYVGIVEPDDFIHRDMYKILLEHENDIVKCSFMNFYGKKGKATPERIFHEVRKKIPANGTKIKPFENPKIFLVDPTIWSAIYKREMLEKNQLKFLETAGASYQDSGFQFKAFVSAKDIFCLEKPLYYYRRDNANSSVNSDQKIDAVKVEFDSVDEFIKTKFNFENPTNISLLDGVNPKNLTDKLIEIRLRFQDAADACRFRSYNWNLNRLKFKNALVFAKIAKQDFRNNSFNPKYFTKEKHARAHELKFSTKHPSFYVFLRPFFSIKNQLKSFLRKIFR